MSTRALVSGFALAATAAAAMAYAPSAHAQARWVLIGTQSIGFQVDRDTVRPR